jgi:indole-3-glycerol phosphate synthase
MREAIKIRKAEEASGLSEVSLRDGTPGPRDFAFAVTTRRRYLARIAGAVRLDPSTPFECADRLTLEPTKLARAAADAGAAAIAIGTDARLFGGSIADLYAVGRSLAAPVLRLDYAVDPRQLYASRAAGADAVLVSAGMLDAPHLIRLQECAQSLQVRIVFESRDEEDLSRALQVPGAVHGLGDLTGETGAWDVARVLALAARLPPRTTAIALSGVRSDADLGALEGKIDAALVTAPWLSAVDPILAAPAWFTEAT